MVKFADLGFAELEMKKQLTNVGTLQYRALEIILGIESGPEIDLWSSACTIFELATSNLLFEVPVKLVNEKQDYAHLLIIENTLGGIPMKIAKRGRNFKNFFKTRGIAGISQLQKTTEFKKLNRI